eukprot:1138993-Pelagomonas_calceolata.AAC.4
MRSHSEPLRQVRVLRCFERHKLVASQQDLESSNAWELGLAELNRAGHDWCDEEQQKPRQVAHTSAPNDCIFYKSPNLMLNMKAPTGCFNRMLGMNE